MAYQPDALSRLDHQREILEQRSSLACISKVHALKHDPSIRRPQSHSVRTVCYPQRLRLQQHHLFHLVHAALQVRYMLSHIAQIAMHNEVARENESHIARRRPAAPPQQHGIERNQNTQSEQDRQLRHIAPCGKRPVPVSASPPFAQHSIKASFFAPFRTE